MQLALGLDTGGTYTDAVLVNYEMGDVLAGAEALTTRYDLSLGIGARSGQCLPSSRPKVPLCVGRRNTRRVLDDPGDQRTGCGSRRRGLPPAYRL